MNTDHWVLVEQASGVCCFCDSEFRNARAWVRESVARTSLMIEDRHVAGSQSREQGGTQGETTRRKHAGERADAQIAAPAGHMTHQAT